MTFAFPSLSVVIPVFNGADFLREAIESVLRQIHEPFEIIVVDDGSTDGSASVVAEMAGPITVLRQPRRGPAAARNLGLSRTSGEVITFLDADDLWAEGRLVRQLPPLAESSGLDMVLGLTLRVSSKPDERGVPHLLHVTEPEALRQLGCGFFRRSLFERIGVLDERMTFSEDEDFFLRAEEQGVSTLFVQEVVQYYRMHATNLTRDHVSLRRSLFRLTKNRLDRRRGMPGPPLLAARRPAAARANET